MTYQIKSYITDPFDIMCGESPEHEIELWEDTTIEELHHNHEEELEMDSATPDWMIEEMKADGSWEPAPSDFDEWLRKAIENGRVRTAA